MRTLRKLAYQLESGELDACKVGVLAMLTDDGKVPVFGFGPTADDLQPLALFRLGEHKPVQAMLDTN